MSERIEDGWSAVLLVHAGAVECVTFEVDAQGNRRSTDETCSSLDEVCSLGENGTEEELTLGVSAPCGRAPRRTAPAVGWRPLGRSPLRHLWLPLSALAIHTVIEAKIPVCKPERPASEPLCVEPITGLKFVHPSAQT